MSFARITPTGVYRSDQLDSQEYVDIGAAGIAKRVVLFDSSGNEIYSGAAGSIVDGTTTVAAAGTAVRITAASTPCKGVWLSGDTVAGIFLYVGASTVVGNATGQRGICIIPGNNPVFLEVSNLNLLYVDAASNGGKLAWCYTV